MHIVEKFRYFLIGENDDISELKTVDSANIIFDSETPLKVSANISITLLNEEALDVSKKLRIVHCKDSIESVVGTFLFTTPSQNINPSCKQIDVTCYSTLWLLEINKTTSRLMVGKGTNVVNEITRIMGLLGFGVALDITLSDKTTSVQHEFEIGTPYLTIINTLLGVINYTSLYVNAMGDYVARPYILPSEREINIRYDETDPLAQIECDLTSEFDYFDVPNVFVRYVNNPEATDLIAVYKNENPSSPTSILYRPTNVHSEEVQDCSDMQTLYDMCKRACMSATNKYHTIKFSSSINPKHSYMDCVYINLNGVSGKLIETSWSFNCEAGSSMEHVARMGVNI